MSISALFNKTLILNADVFLTRDDRFLLVGLTGDRFVEVYDVTGAAPKLARRIEIFRDRNFSSATLLMFVTGGMLVSSSALLAPYLQTLGVDMIGYAGGARRLPTREAIARIRKNGAE